MFLRSFFYLAIMLETTTKCEQCHNASCIIRINALGEEMKAFLATKHNIQCKRGQQFILEGAPVHGLYFVYKGKAKVVKTGFQGKEQIVRLAKDGEIIGHRGFGSREAYQISAVALEDSTLCYFKNDALKQMLLSFPKLTYDFMLFYAEELNLSENKVRKFAQMTVREKVIDSILYMYRKFGQDGDILNIQLSRKELADLAGTTDEQVTRTITSLKNENLIRTQGKQLGVVNIELLRREVLEHNFFLNS